MVKTFFVYLWLAYVALAVLSPLYTLAYWATR